MNAIAYTIRQGPNGLEVQFSADIASGNETEKRLAKWLNFAMLEIQSRIKNGITMEKEGIAKLARAACRTAMEQASWAETSECVGLV